jgi:NADP-dependent aldehyde dehydrogenase
VTAAAPLLIDGRWLPSEGDEVFETVDPATGDQLGRYPVSPWPEVDAALEAGIQAYHTLSDTRPETIAALLMDYADRIDASAEELALTAERETGLARSPRLTGSEIPRTTDQLRQAARAAIDRSWVDPVLCPGSGICSYLAPIPGVVCIFGPNNFPFAFNGLAGGDFAAAIATRHPVIAKANPGHPETTQRLAALASEAVKAVGLPPSTVQLIYRTSHPDGSRMVADPRVAATAYTGSRGAGLSLKASADAAGKPIYLEMSSVNPVVILPGALESRCDLIAAELVASALLGAGQFCTSPGLVFVIASPSAEAFIDRYAAAVSSTPAATLLGRGIVEGLDDAYERWSAAGAVAIGIGPPGTGRTYYPNTVMRVGASSFLDHGEALQSEAFGNMSLVVVADDVDELIRCLDSLVGNLTGAIYADETGTDEDMYREVASVLRARVGRLLNNKAPTGVAVVPAMNHGGPFPATGHPGFTAVGIPASLRRFGMLQCFDNVPDHRLPAELQASNPLGLLRRVDDRSTREAVTWGTVE